MSKVETLTLSSVWTLVSSPHGFYLLGYSWLFGMSFWLTFFGGFIASRNLPRPLFAHLQHRTLTIFFGLSVALTTSLMVMWTMSHPNVLTHIFQPHVADVAQIYMLAIVLVGQGINYFLIEPVASKTIFKRLELEKEEGKSATDPDASDAIKELSRQFRKLHGMSAVAGLSSIGALIFHGLWIGHAGVKGN